MNDIKDQVKLMTRVKTREWLSELRSTASQLKHTGKVENEEECFREMLNAYSKGIIDEMCTITNPLDVSQLLDPFYGKAKRS